MKDHNQRPILRGKSVILRQAQIADAKARLAFGRHDEIVTMFGGNAEKLGPYTLEDAQNWLQFQMEQDCGWVIETNGQLLPMRNAVLCQRAACAKPCFSMGHGKMT